MGRLPGRADERQEIGGRTSEDILGTLFVPRSPRTGSSTPGGGWRECRRRSGRDQHRNDWIVICCVFFVLCLTLGFLSMSGNESANKLSAGGCFAKWLNKHTSANSGFSDPN